MEKLLNTRDLCKQLGISRDMAYALMKSQGFPSITIGSRYFVTQENLDKFFSSEKKITIVI